MKKYISFLTWSSFCILALLLLAACGPTVSSQRVQSSVNVNPSFQSQTTPIPTVPPYRCGAWASNNAPGAYSSIFIYSRLTKSVTGVSGATASAVVHFENSDVALDAQPTSDSDGLVAFPLSIAGRQPRQLPATVDVTFAIGKAKVTCEAFFTPQ